MAENKSKLTYGFMNGEEMELAQMIKNEGEENSLVKSIINTAKANDIQRLAFEADPAVNNTYQALYIAKTRLIPDSVLKRVAVQDELVATIVRARQQHISSFGRPRPDRFSLGFVIEPNPGVLNEMSSDERHSFADKIRDAVSRIWHCGSTEGWGREKQMTFSQCLQLLARSAVVVGRAAVERIFTYDSYGVKKFHSFRPIDGGTIYRATPQREAAESVREQARLLLQQLNSKKLLPERFQNDEYAWVQIIEGRPYQAFTSEECAVFNFYPAPDVELGGYPVTPIDTTISAIATHINITTHNKLYFQNGRAAKGMLVIKSDDANPQVVHNIKQFFNASINSVSSSWRMPVFGCGSGEDISFQQIEGSSRDMEFQYLSDMNARVIMGAFMISPDEIPGWGFLSKGTSSQALSECIAGDSRIFTPQGLRTAESIVGEFDEVFTKVWSGTKWVDGRVFKSGEKDLRQTKLSCGIEIKTSPDHRFLSIGADGEPVWKEQSKLKTGDFVLVNKEPVQGFEEAVPLYNGKKLTKEMMEVLGWMTGDGGFYAPRKRSGAQLQLFYHHSKERDIWERHNKIISDFGLSNSHKELFRSQKQIDKALEKFKTVSNSYLKNIIYDTEFYRWLINLGFAPSSSGKRIPAALNVMPVEYRQAFLKGLFSADGGRISKTGSVALSIQDDKLRDEVRQLLLSLGIRTLWCDKTKTSKAKFGNGIYKRLSIKDKSEFWKQIGFIQKHKQLPDNVVPGKWTNDDVPKEVVSKYMSMCLDSEGYKSLSKGRRDAIVSYISGKKASWNKLLETLAICSVSAPDWLTKFHVETVDFVKEFDSKEKMYDVEMFDNVHAFIAEGFVTHNSNNQYQLEASRDTGLRPLLYNMEDFFNTEIFPYLDPELAKLCKIRFVGLDTDNAEKEAVRLQQDQALHLSYDEILERVEKRPIGESFGGTIPLNQAYKAYLDQYFTVGEILEKFCGVKDASKNPDLAYRRDPFFFQWVQLQQQQKMMEQQQQQAQQQAQMVAQQQQKQPPQGQGGQDSSEPEPPSSHGFKGEAHQQSDQLARSIDQAMDLLTKSEKQLPANKKKLLAVQKKVVNDFLKGWDDDLKEAQKEIVKVAEHFKPKK